MARSKHLAAVRLSGDNVLGKHSVVIISILTLRD